MHGVRGVRPELSDQRHPGYPRRGLCRLHYSDMDQGEKNRLVQWRGMLLSGGWSGGYGGL